MEDRLRGLREESPGNGVLTAARRPGVSRHWQRTDEHAGHIACWRGEPRGGQHLHHCALSKASGRRRDCTHSESSRARPGQLRRGLVRPTIWRMPPSWARRSALSCSIVRGWLGAMLGHSPSNAERSSRVAISADLLGVREGHPDPNRYSGRRLGLSGHLARFLHLPEDDAPASTAGRGDVSSGGRSDPVDAAQPRDGSSGARGARRDPLPPALRCQTHVDGQRNDCLRASLRRRREIQT